MKAELGGKIMAEFASLRPNIYFSLTPDNDMNKKMCKKVSLKTKKNKI